jgi:hypothetical protein
MNLIQCASYSRKGIPKIPVAKTSHYLRGENIRCFAGLLEFRKRPIPAGSIAPYEVAIGSNETVSVSRHSNSMSCRFASAPLDRGLPRRSPWPSSRYGECKPPQKLF